MVLVVGSVFSAHGLALSIGDTPSMLARASAPIGALGADIKHARAWIRFLGHFAMLGSAGFVHLTSLLLSLPTISV
eukprot:2260388-Amphidinium_carterae.1